MTHPFPESFDVVYSTLTFLNIKEKRAAIQKVAQLLKRDGIFVLSVSRDTGDWLDMGTRRLRVYPDDPTALEKDMTDSGLTVTNRDETEFAYIITAKK